MLFVLMPLGITGYVLYTEGVFEPLIGSAGADRFNQASADLAGQGYGVAIDREEFGIQAGPKTTYAELQKDRCYAAVVTAGQPIRSVQLAGPKGQKITGSDGLTYKKTLEFCASASGLHPLTVILDRGGRMTVGFFIKKKREAARRKKRSGSKVVGESAPEPGVKTDDQQEVDGGVVDEDASVGDDEEPKKPVKKAKKRSKPTRPVRSYPTRKAAPRPGLR